MEKEVDHLRVVVVGTLFRKNVKRSSHIWTYRVYHVAVRDIMLTYKHFWKWNLQCGGTYNSMSIKSSPQTHGWPCIWWPLSGKKKLRSPNVGLEPTTLRLRVSCSTDWASRAACYCTLVLRYYFYFYFHNFLCKLIYTVRHSLSRDVLFCFGYKVLDSNWAAQ